jgi:putative transposase
LRRNLANDYDDVTRECLAAIPDTSISGKRVARELTALIDARGKPGMTVSDNGTEFTSNAILGIPARESIRVRGRALRQPTERGKTLPEID